MPGTTSESFDVEAKLIERFAQSYRRRFGQMIAQLNHGPSPALQSECIRLCVEAMDMVLTSQDRMAQTLRRIDQAKTPRRAA
jgi:hypothetical protein